MGRQKWTDERFGQRIRAEREAEMSQADVARKLSAAGVRPMYPTTVSKIETAERSVRINEAVGLADLFGMSLDNLLGRPDDSTVAFALTTLCRYAGDAQRQIKRAQETAADIGDQPGVGGRELRSRRRRRPRQVAEDMGAALQAAQSTVSNPCRTCQRRDCGSCGPMRRKRRAGVEDLWTQSVRLADDTTRTVPTARAGRGMRWRARYVDAEGRERTKAFRRKIDAAQWLDGITAQFATGTYVKPEAGQVTVAAAYASWSASQGHISPKTAATRRSAWTSRRRTAVGWRGSHRCEDRGGPGMGVQHGRR